MDLARHYRIRGRVQGVGYRYFVRRIALRLGVRGWVRNLPGGDVEVHAEAPKPVLEEFRAQLERGPSAADVREVIENSAAQAGRHSSFEIL